jgi:hypothetical protein
MIHFGIIVTIVTDIRNADRNFDEQNASTEGTEPECLLMRKRASLGKARDGGDDDF